jgi:hypothetical protein
VALLAATVLTCCFLKRFLVIATLCGYRQCCVAIVPIPAPLVVVLRFFLIKPMVSQYVNCCHYVLWVLISAHRELSCQTLPQQSIFALDTLSIVHTILSASRLVYLYRFHLHTALCS